MLNAAHVLEVALLLLAAFLVGAISGAVARVIARQLHAPQRRPAVYTPARVERVVPSRSEAAPLAEGPAEVVAKPEDEVPPEADQEVAPAEPLVAVAVEPEPEAPAPEPVPEVSETATPTPVEVVVSAVGAPVVAVEEVIAPPQTEPEAAAMVEPPAAPTNSVEAPALQAAPTPVGPPARPKRRPAEDEDESAAMRAIEGNWTPRRRSGKAGNPGDAAVVASGAAVEAAMRAAEVAVAGAAAVAVPDPAPEPVVQSGRPAGLKSPRNGRKDNLTHVIGILPIIETSLNSLGVFHFDQVADLTDQNAAWLERHLGIEGRIGREQWREQARELALAVRPRVDA